MPENENIRLPNFALPLFARLRCHKCGQKIGETHVISAGIGRSREGILCFFFEFSCPSCRHARTLRYLTHAFAGDAAGRNWWEQIGRWHDAAPSPADQPKTAGGTVRPAMPRIGPIFLRDNDTMRSGWVRGGYAGDVGPLMLLYDNEDGDKPTSGVLRVVRRDHISIHAPGDPDCLPRDFSDAFATVAAGDSFQFAGNKKMWKKLSVGEIAEIIRNRVFTVTGGDDLLVPTAKPRARKGHGSNAPKSRKRTGRPPRDAGPLDS